MVDARILDARAELLLDISLFGVLDTQSAVPGGGAARCRDDEIFEGAAFAAEGCFAGRCHEQNLIFFIEREHCPASKN